jgi:hypothetical protein
MGKIRKFINIAWIIAIALGLGGAVLGQLNSAERDASGEVVKEGTLEVEEFQLGDCLDSLEMKPEGVSDSDLVYSGAGVPCDTPHEFEIYAETSLPYSSQFSTQIGANAIDFCESQFEAYIGINYLNSELEIDAIFPTEESFRAGDRKVQCLVSELGERRALVESIKGSGEAYAWRSSSGNLLWVQLSEITPGTCLNMYEHEVAGRTYEEVDCEEPHEMELYFNSALGAEAVADLKAASEAKCAEEFENYVGTAWENSKLTFTYIPPEELSGEGLESNLICFAEDEGRSSLTGSVQDSRK